MLYDKLAIFDQKQLSDPPHNKVFDTDYFDIIPLMRAPAIPLGMH